MQLINQEIYQNSLQYIPFTASGNHTNRLLTFTALEDINSSEVALQKNSQVTRGSIQSITSSFDGSNTLINVRIETIDTINLDPALYPYSLNTTNLSDFTDSYILNSGYLNLLPNMQNPNNVYPTEEYTNQIYDAILLLQVVSGNVVNIIKNIGFDPSISVSVSHNGTGVYTLISTLPIFLSNLDISCKASSPSSLNTMLIFNNNLGYSQTRLQIGVYDINSQLVIDSDFFITLQRIRGITPVETITTESGYGEGDMVGVKNGINTVFTFPNGDIPLVDSERIYLDGVKLRKNTGYTINYVIGQVTMMAGFIPTRTQLLETDYRV